MNDNRVISATAFAILIVLAVFLPDAGISLFASAVISALTIFLINKNTDEPAPVIRVFLIALVLRLIVGIVLHYLDLRDFFGADANTYDSIADSLTHIWHGESSTFSRYEIYRATKVTGAGWGMNYGVAGIYWIFGRNILLVQTICGTIGAATVPAIYFCARRIYNNHRVAIISAYFAALFPAMVIWSSQLLKDGLIIFLLVISMTLVMRLREKLSIIEVILLGLCLFGILSLRFYIFYMVAVAVVGSFFIGISGSTQSTLARITAVIILGIGLTYFGVIRIASADLDTTTDLKNVQRSRLDLARSADSGFGSDADVSTPTGALTTLPLGLTYLFLAPFPWESRTLRQAITIPEELVWWGMIILIISGLIYTIRNRFREALPILIFTLMLTIAYSIFQGNVGTAYRQRTQIQVFLFIFAAVGYELIQERRRDRKGLAQRKRQSEMRWPQHRERQLN